MLQIETHECNNLPYLYPTCNAEANGEGCISWYKSLFCGGNCKNRCYPDSRSCCDCTYPPKECFPSTSKVKLADGKSVRMSELQLGDQVQTGNTFLSHLNMAQGSKQEIGKQSITQTTNNMSEKS